MSFKGVIKIVLIIVSLAMVNNFYGQKFPSKLISLEMFSDVESGDSGIVIIDIRKNKEFAEGHLPKALNIWRTNIVDSTIEYGGMMASRKIIGELLSSLGVKPTDKIIIYDNKGEVDAARFWWILTTYGHSNSYLLDGGYSNWKDAGGEISTDIINPTKTDYKFPADENYILLANQQDVKNAIDYPNTILIDTRTFDEYIGNIQKKGAYRKGRIPTSINIDWANAVNYDGDKKFKSLKELKSIFESHGITTDKNIIAYCQSGVRSAHTTFVLTQLLGYDNVKNYDGSWIEWSYNRELPISVGLDEPYPELAVAEVDGYWNLFIGSFGAYANYLWSEITFQARPWYQNYFWWLIVLSLFVWLLEIAFPWRKNQPKIRTDFWIDAFYMFFNFFIFNLVIFIAFSNLTTQVVKDVFGGDLSSLALINIQNYPEWSQLLIFFVATDFIQWFTHVMLHRFNFLWRFHKVHHSVEEMGFAAHLRYHWMENVFYTPMKYIMVMLIGGFQPNQAFIVYYVAIAIGHLNHANIGWSYGPLKYIVNNPKMHIWHHSYQMLQDKPYGSNFGISLSIWDYIFKTNYIPYSGKDIKLGFSKIEEFPKTFFNQLFYGFKKKN